MEGESLAAALEREHREIDEGIETFIASGDRDTQALRRVIRVLRRHIFVEEEFLFPPLREAGLVTPVIVMLREHAQIWMTLDSLERGLDADAVGDAELMLCHRLTVQLQHHNLKEERILYPQVDTVLAAPATGRLRTFLGSGRVPEGWVCQKARC